MAGDSGGQRRDRETDVAGRKERGNGGKGRKLKEYRDAGPGDFANGMGMDRVVQTQTRRVVGALKPNWARATRKGGGKETS